MKKYIVAGSIVAFVLVAVTVFAIQGRNNQEAAPQAAVAQEVGPRTADGDPGSGPSGSGCASAAGCGSAAGGCGALADPAQSADRIERIKQYLVSYYTEKAGLTGVTIEVQDLGCHQEATVMSEGKVVEKLSINGDRITKIGS